LEEYVASIFGVEEKDMQETSLKQTESKVNLQSPACYQPHSGFLLGLLFNPEDGGDMFFGTGLPGVVFQKVELFITTAVRTSNHTIPHKLSNTAQNIFMKDSFVLYAKFRTYFSHRYCDMTPENRNSEVRIDVYC
jgi:hypothetical protein